jgi:hypothetical protein
MSARRPLCENATQIHVEDMSGSRTPSRNRSARNSVRKLRTSFIEASFGASKDNHSRVSEGSSPNVRNRNSWWFLLKPGKMFPCTSSASSSV